MIISIIFRIVRVSVNTKLILIGTKPCLFQSPVEIFDLRMHLIYAGFKFRQKVVLKLLQRTFPRSPNLLAVFRQFAFFQEAHLFCKFVVIHSVITKSARLKITHIVGAFGKQFLLCHISFIDRLREMIAKIFDHNGRFSQTFQLLLIAGNAHILHKRFAESPR